MNQVVHDRPEQLHMIIACLLQGEQPIAVHDCIAHDVILWHIINR